MLIAELAKLTSRIEHLVAELPDGRVVMSFPRAGRVCAAQILAELGDVRARFPSEHQFATEAGVVPVMGRAREEGVKDRRRRPAQPARSVLDDVLRPLR